MWKRILAFMIGGTFGVAAGFALGTFAYPYIFLADIVAMEEIADADSRPVVATGKFIHANPSDPIHYGQGAVTLYDGVCTWKAISRSGPGRSFTSTWSPTTRCARRATSRTACSWTWAA